MPISKARLVVIPARRIYPLLCGLVLSTVVTQIVHSARADEPKAERKPADGVTPTPPPGGEMPVATGRVMDEAGDPVAGAEVRCVGVGRGIVFAVTDRDGAFRLPLPTGSMYPKSYTTAVFASDPDGRRQGTAQFRVPDGAKNVRVTLRPAKSVTVRVSDAAKRPAADARVVLMSTGQMQAATATTGADGTAVVRYPADVDIGTVYALKGGAGFDLASSLPGRRGGERKPLPDDVPLVLTGARAVRITVADGAGKPVPGLNIVPWTITSSDRAATLSFSSCPAVWVTTDAAGVARFDWIPADFGQGISFTVESPEFSHAMPFTLKKDAPDENGTMRVIRRARLSGRVVGPDGQPAAGIAVEARGAGSVPLQNGHWYATTRADGSYEMTVNGEDTYAAVVIDDRWAAESRSGVVAREGESVGGIDFRLAEGTILRGRVTAGSDQKPAEQVSLTLLQQVSQSPTGLRRAGTAAARPPRFSWHAWTDADGRYRFVVGPGAYTLMASPAGKSVPITVSREREVINDINLPQRDLATLTGTVLDVEGKPVAGVAVRGHFMARPTGRSGLPWFEATTAADGTFSVERDRVPAAVYGATADKSQAGLTRLTADQAQVTVRVGPLATARGRLLDPDGKPLAGGRVQYAVRVPSSEEPNAGFYSLYGGNAIADADGWYTCPGMLVGEKYYISHETTPDRGPWTTLTTISASKAETIELGDTKLPKPREPYRPPTPEEAAVKYFTGRGELKDRIAAAQIEARRYHTRVLLVVGDPREAATRTLVDLTRNRQSVADAMSDFEEVAVSAEDAAGLAAFRELYGRAEGLNRWPALVVLGEDGSVLATKTPRLETDRTAAIAELREFLSSQAAPRPDAQAMLTAALARAKAEGKRVFLKETAAWCGPCRLLSRFLDRHKPILEPHFVFVDVDSGRFAHGREVMERYRGKEPGGIPWCAVLDADGKMLANWDGPGGNIGFPTEPKEIDHLLKVLSDNAPKLTEGERAELRKTLEKSGK